VHTRISNRRISVVHVVVDGLDMRADRNFLSAPKNDGDLAIIIIITHYIHCQYVFECRVMMASIHLKNIQNGSSLMSMKQ
jgi:hypothetical protein